MKAVVQDRYGGADVLAVRDIEEPAPADDEVLIRVRAAGVDPGAWHLMTGRPYLVRLGFGLRAPKVKVRGRDVSGTVETAGQGVTQFKPGDDVYGTVEGSFAELACASETRFARKPGRPDLRTSGRRTHLRDDRPGRGAGSRQGPRPASTSSSSAPGAGSGRSRSSWPRRWAPTSPVSAAPRRSSSSRHRRRRGHRLHPGGLRRRVAAVRRHHRHRGETAAFTRAPRARCRRCPRHRRWRGRRPMAAVGSSGSSVHPSDRSGGSRS